MNTRSRSWRAAFILLIALLTANIFHARPAQANPGADVDINIFFGALAPYGNWVDHGDYGRVWYPRGVSRGWRPYTDGHWSYNARYGWIWVSDWAWGWAPFHYGRWLWDDGRGWLWIPGRVWAPAWVHWRYGGGYAAWAPMPPTVIWRPGYGMVTRHFNHDRDFRPEWWVGVPEHRLYQRHIGRYLVDPRRNGRFLNVTKRFVDVSVEKDVIVNRGIPVKLLEKNTGKRIHPIAVREVTRIEDRNRGRSRGKLTVVRLPMKVADSEETRRDEELAIKVKKQNEERQRVRPEADGQRSEKPEIKLPGRLQKEAPAERNIGAEPGMLLREPQPTPQDKQDRQPPEAKQRGTDRRQPLQMEEQRLRKEQADRAREKATRQLQERQEQNRQQQWQQQRQMETQRRQAGRAREEATRQRQSQEQQEQNRQQQLQQQRQMKIQRRQAERVHEEATRQQNKQPLRRQQDGAESGPYRPQHPRHENRYGNRPDGR